MEDKKITEPKENIVEQPNVSNSRKPVVYDKNINYEEQIEAKRIEMKAATKSNKRLSLINMIVTVALICAGLILFVQKEPSWLKFFGIGILGAAVVFLIVMYFVNKKKYPNKVKEYISFVTESYNGILFNDSEFSDVTFDLDEKIDQSEILSDYVYKDMTSFYSRNMILGTYKGANFKAIEISMNREFMDKKKTRHREVIFAGKYISFPNTLKLENRVVITTRCSGETTYDIPNGVEDLTELSHDGLTTIYGKTNADTKVLGSKFVGAVKAIKTEEPLLNVTVVVWEGHTGIYLSYSNAIINVPLEKTADFNALDLAKKQIKQALEAASLINKVSK